MGDGFCQVGEDAYEELVQVGSAGLGRSHLSAALRTPSADVSPGSCMVLSRRGHVRYPWHAVERGSKRQLTRTERVSHE
jgi:hypothetical protein